ncbi:TIGR00730 family Rossman fold protein [Rhodovulum sp. DZ06]|uniref:LOG family protein n=1 Tax=Rhodovulum sp. DZ06 TaxID=3425126 RepID=UPI003D33119E
MTASRFVLGDRLSVCVYCGSRFGTEPAYTEAAEALGAGLAARNMRLVYGAGDVGLMGAVARAAQAGGGETFGVIPKHLFDREVGKRDLTSFVITETMHERKKVMFMNSDVVIALPGGAGTLDEMYEALTWRQLGLHDKPLILSDVDGFWQPLAALNDHMVAKGFLDRRTADALERVEGAGATLARLDEIAAG